MCLAIKYSHDNKIIHRDIKTTNIFLDEFDNIKLGDFGTATNLLFTGQNFINFAGTPLYVSPEIINGIPYSYKADIWALGVVCYEILTGNSPFYETNFSGLLTKICCSEPAPILNDFSLEVKNFTFSLLNKNHEQRPNINQIFKDEYIMQNLEKFSDEKKQLYSMTTLPDFQLTEVQLEKEFKSMKSLRYSEFFEGNANNSKAFSPARKNIELIDIIGSSLFFKNGGTKGLSSQVSIDEIENHESIILENSSDNDISSKVRKNNSTEAGMGFLALFQNSHLSENNFKLGDLSKLTQYENSNTIMRSHNQTQNTASNMINGSNFSDDLSLNMCLNSQVADIKTNSINIKKSEVQTASKFKDFTSGGEKLVKSEYAHKTQGQPLKASKMKIVSTFKPKVSTVTTKNEKTEKKPLRDDVMDNQIGIDKNKAERAVQKTSKLLGVPSNALGSTKNTLKNEYISKPGVTKTINGVRLSNSNKIVNSLKTSDKIQTKSPISTPNTKLLYPSNYHNQKKETATSIATTKKRLPSDYFGEFSASNFTDTKTIKKKSSNASSSLNKTSLKQLNVSKQLKDPKSLTKNTSEFANLLSAEIRTFIMNYGCLEVEGLLQNKQNLKEIFEVAGHGAFNNEEEVDLLYQSVKTNLDTVKAQFMNLNA